ncbi:DUF4198 domain-containing protein [Klebsiella pneumoniae]|uniref:DUF4198 domain-containing protein n=1 Tax=Klebsiella pneumoniae TaxID=573 RepID=A0AAW8AMT7_KLEPN|nr:DUF4198 domain-containing protein [Klebsiella pneumoniae]EIV7913570.1 DUF4198 domain-containing protein [Klebsiella pneumoniae]EIW3861105.1 DUF4198 domain-containing protein [Klebsiella pneumoniae]EIW3892877.1 DUF4198 domain-containing protein [Klebsiella pneumoniae]MCG5620602.1 DUF4198 domain-containing protein [Klebsiella pneumoniae]MCS6643487.1 DUF4198 domain-containing protein [Klebsiella pneumoniae subsp. pneumoniae]
MMKKTFHIAALCLITSGHVLAHDVWITGKQVQDNVIAEVGYGHNFPARGTIPDRRAFFESPRIYDGKETITLKPTSTDYVYKTGSAGKENGYVLSTHMKPGYWSRTSSGWKPVSREGRNDVAYCEFVTKYAKSFIPGEQRMPAQLYQSPAGHELEIIPLSDISRISDGVKLKVLYKRSPLAGAALEFDSVSYLASSGHNHDGADEHRHPVHKAELTAVSDGNGIITLSSLHAGQWLAKVRNKQNYPDRRLCDETVDVATLSFSRN